MCGKSTPGNKSEETNGPHLPQQKKDHVDICIFIHTIPCTRKFYKQKESQYPRKDKASVLNSGDKIHAHPVQIGVGVFWHVVVENNVDSFNIHASAKQVSSNQNPPLEILELLIAGQPEGSIHVWIIDIFGTLLTPVCIMYICNIAKSYLSS